MKVLFLVTDDFFFWSHRRSLAAAVRDAGGEVVVATAPGPYRERIEAEGFAFRPVQLCRSMRPDQLALAFADVVRLYRGERPDLVQHVSMCAILSGSLAARLTGVPGVVNLVTGLGWVFGSGPAPLRFAVREAYRLCLCNPRSWTIFQNPDDRADFVSRGLVTPGRSSVILGSGVDTGRFRPTPEPDGTPTVLLAARMLRPKGVGDLVEAGRLLRRDGVAHRIVLAGNPDERNPTTISRRQLVAWHDEGTVDWVGHRDDVDRLLGDCHVACLPSYYREGVPKFLLEAAASARPIVTTDTPGCREAVRDGESGVLIHPQRPQALAAALKELLTNTDSRRTMGAAGRRLVDERFKEDVVIRQTLGVYESVTGTAWT